MLLPLLVAAAVAGPVQDSLIFHGRSGRTVVRPPRVTADLQIDGRLDEPAWRQAAVLTGFSEYQPVDNLPAEDSTEIHVMYTEHEMLIGIRAFERHGSVHATLTDRDKIQSNDHIQFIIDTFNDKRRGLVFMVNPLGVQGDGTYAENGSGGDGQIDLSPDFLFSSKGHVTADGYEVEIRIPFKSLRYQSKPVQDWGMQVVRAVQHSGHRQTWAPAERGAQSFLAQSGSLVEMREIKRGLVMDLNPTVTTRADGSRNATTDRWDYKAGDPEFGGNIRWGVTENLTLNATANPDFSQVEADVQQVQYDPRQGISFPEKRPFFLEGNENFQVPFGLIYTRSIVQPVAAAKISGKIAGTNIGFLSAVDDKPYSATGADNPIFNVLRLRRDVGARSSVGMVYTDKMDGDDWNRVAGVDSRLVKGAYTLSTQYAASFTDYGNFEATAAPLFDVRLNRSGRDWGFNSQAQGIHQNFIAGSGFIGRAGAASANISPRKNFYGKPGAFFEQYSVGMFINGRWNYDGFTNFERPQDIQLHLLTNATLRGGWNINLQPWIEWFGYDASIYSDYYIVQGTDTVPYVEGETITNLGGQITINTPQWKNFSANANVTPGRDVNFAEWSEGWILFADINAQWRPTDKVRVDARYVEQRFNRVTDGSQVSLRQIPRLKLEYQVSRPVFVRIVGQYDANQRDALRDDSRTGSPIFVRNGAGSFIPLGRQSRGSFRADALFSYQPNPGTVVFAGYGSGMANPLDAFGRLERTTDGFFIKVSYLHRL